MTLVGRTKLPDGVGRPFGFYGVTLAGVLADELARIEGWEEVRPGHAAVGKRLAARLEERGVRVGT